MTSLRIYDLKDHVLALDLRDVLRLLAPRSLQASWIVSSVKSSRPEHEWFEATGDGGEKLQALAQSKSHVSGADLAALAEKTQQVIWGEFTGFAPTPPGNIWVVIRAADSTFYEIETDDETVLGRIISAYNDIRTGETPVASWPLKRFDE
jgi:hypothetical protein